MANRQEMCRKGEKSIGLNEKSERGVDAAELPVGSPDAVNYEEDAAAPAEPLPDAGTPVEEVDEQEHAHAYIYYNHEDSEDHTHG